MIYFSSDMGFLNSDVHKHIPESAREISQELYDTLMTNQSKGYPIIADEHGMPVSGPLANVEVLDVRVPSWKVRLWLLQNRPIELDKLLTEVEKLSVFDKEVFMNGVWSANSEKLQALFKKLSIDLNEVLFKSMTEIPVEF